MRLHGISKGEVLEWYFEDEVHDVLYVGMGHDILSDHLMLIVEKTNDKLNIPEKFIIIHPENLGVKTYKKGNKKIPILRIKP